MCFWLGLLRMLICGLSSKINSWDCRSTLARCIPQEKEGEKAVIDWLLMDYLFRLKPFLQPCQYFPCSLSSFDLSISKSMKWFTVCALSVSSGGTARVTLHQGEHAALMTTCITLPWCHYNSAPLKSEPLGTLTAQQPPTLQLNVRYVGKLFVLLVAKTKKISQWHLCSFMKQTSWGPSTLGDSAVHPASDLPVPTCCQTHALKGVNISFKREI